jgi:hypothetical protein
MCLQTSGGLLCNHMSLDLVSSYINSPSHRIGSRVTTCLRTRGSLPCSCELPDPTTCYFISALPRGRLLSRHVSLDPRRAWSSSHILTKRAPVCRGRRGTFTPVVGSWIATTTVWCLPSVVIAQDRYSAHYN